MSNDMLFMLAYTKPLNSITLLGNPEPHPLDEVPWLILRPDLSIERSLAGPDVGLAGLDERRTLDDLPANVEQEVDGDDDVAKKRMSVMFRHS